MRNFFETEISFKWINQWLSKTYKISETKHDNMYSKRFSFTNLHNCPAQDIKLQVFII